MINTDLIKPLVVVFVINWYESYKTLLKSNININMKIEIIALNTSPIGIAAIRIPVDTNNEI